MTEWAVHRLGDLATVVDCEHKTAPQATPGEEYGYSVGTPHIREGRINYRAAKRVSKETFEAWSRRAVPGAGDLILAREAPVGQVGRVSSDLPTCLGQRTVLIRPAHDVVEERYLHAYLLGRDAQRWMEDRSFGSTVDHLNVADVREIPVRLPPLDEQRRIAAVLGAFDDLIETNRAQLRRHWAVSEAVYEIAARPGHTTTLGEVLSLRYGKSLPATKRIPGPYPVVSSAGVTGCHSSALVTGPGVVVGRKGTVGSVTWVFEDFFPIDTAFYVESDVPMLYTYFALRAAGLDQMNTDSAVPGLNRDNALRLPIRLPSEEGMAHFNRVTGPLVEAVRVLEEEIADLTRSRDELLSLLMSGRVRVADVREETA